MYKNILITKNIFLKSLLLFFFLFSYEAFSSNLIEDNYDTLKNNKIEKSANLKSEYILGPGDSLFIEFIGISPYTKTYIINPDGYLNLPEIDNFYAENKTLEEIKKELQSI